VSTVFLLQNQRKQLLGKSGDWLDGRTPATVYRSAHKDEALNQQFEAGSKDYNLRITMMVCELNTKKQPIIDADNLPEAICQAALQIDENEGKL